MAEGEDEMLDVIASAAVREPLRPAGGTVGAPAVEPSLERRAPEPGFEPICAWVLDSTAHLRTMRSELADRVGEVDGEMPHLVGLPAAVVLVASELATNALRHGLSPTVVSLRRREATYLLDVEDQAVHVEPVLAERRLPGEGGFGLYLARRLALDIGWYGAGTAKHVWATFPAPVSAG